MDYFIKLFFSNSANIFGKPYASGYNDTILSRYYSPGSGAISYHTGRTFMATRNIEAGEELFVGRSPFITISTRFIHCSTWIYYALLTYWINFLHAKDYGDDWLNNRKGTSLDNIPRERDYKAAASTLFRLKKGS